MKKISKAVIPVAGLGTRFLPATKVVPKELLPVVDRPALQYVVEEAVESGLNEIIFISNPAKKAIEDHFNSNTVHDELLCKMSCPTALGNLYKLNEQIKITTVIQKEAKGLGHAVLCAKKAVKDEWFVVMLPDMLIDAKIPCSSQLINAYDELHKPIIAVSHAPKEMISQYGIIDADCGKHGKRVCEVRGMVEKPALKDAPSDLFIAGRYLLPPDIFGYLERTGPGKSGEIQLTDALIELKKNGGMYACEFEGELHDTGDKLGYLKANIYYAMKHGEYRGALKGYMEALCRSSDRTS